ncbi:MAG: hypothetical protein R3185_00125 [Candidatus Thermoplasmatota archaeon]|nr:hypothetical protein [Candidatus Thermoplasmatota archaeon]
MRQRTVPFVAILLLTVLLPAPGAAGDGPLVADAGESRVSLGGDSLAVQGRIFGGTAPHTVAWTLDGEDARFADPTSLETTLDVTGLTGDLLLTLTVTDAEGAQATDTVR